MTIRTLSATDRLLTAGQRGLNIVFGELRASRPYPGEILDSDAVETARHVVPGEQGSSISEPGPRPVPTVSGGSVEIAVAENDQGDADAAPESVARQNEGSSDKSEARVKPGFEADEARHRLSASEARLSGALMRVNHVGEVCAQALYEGQALVASSAQSRAVFDQAALEERDHLAWTARRLRELGDRPSLLNPVWYTASFVLGVLAGRAGDRLSMGFMAETERQVEEHLAGHLQRLPQADQVSRAVVSQMKADEAEHATVAKRHGASKLPWPLPRLMRVAGKVMTRTAHYI